MHFSAPYSLKGDLGKENTSGKEVKANFFFSINAKHNRASFTVSGDFALSLGKLVYHVCSQSGIFHCVFSAHLLKYSDSKYIH